MFFNLFIASKLTEKSDLKPTTGASVQPVPELEPAVSRCSVFTEDYLKEEQKERRQEIENMLRRIEEDQRYGLAVTGVVWSWLATNHDKIHRPFGMVVAVIPALVMLLFWYRWWNLHKAIGVVAEYTILLEAQADLPISLGWERWLKANDPTEKKHPRASLVAPNFWFWVMLTSANIAIGVLYAYFGR